MNVPCHYYYVLDGREIRAVDMQEWADWFRTGNRRVAETFIGEYRVSTVFLSIDHSFSAAGPPVLFESMVFGQKTVEIRAPDGSTWVSAESLDWQPRYRTYDEAERGHEVLCEEVRRLTGNAEQVTADAIRNAMKSRP